MSTQKLAQARQNMAQAIDLLERTVKLLLDSGAEATAEELARTLTTLHVDRRLIVAEYREAARNAELMGA